MVVTDKVREILSDAHEMPAGAPGQQAVGDVRAAGGNGHAAARGFWFEQLLAADRQLAGEIIVGHRLKRCRNTAGKLVAREELGMGQVGEVA